MEKQKKNDIIIPKGKEEELKDILYTLHRQLKDTTIMRKNKLHELNNIELQLEGHEANIQRVSGALELLLEHKPREPKVYE